MGRITEGGRVTATVIEQARAELERASQELERLTDELHDRTLLVERLEMLADALLDMVYEPAVVVDPEGTIVAVSRGAATKIPKLADALGRSVASVLPDWDHDGDETNTVALPDGSTLRVLEP